MAIRRIRGTWADRTRRAVARAHKLKPARLVVIAASSALLLLHPSVPARLPMLSLIHPSVLRYVTLCGVRLTNPTRSLAALPPAAAAAAAAAPSPSSSRPLLPPACPPTGPRNRSLPYHRATPRTDSPITRPPPILSLRPPTPLPAGRLLFALRDSALGLFSLPTAVPVAALTPFPPVPPCPATTSRRPASPPSGNQHTRKPCAVEHDRQLRDYLLSDRMSRVYACERMRKGREKRRKDAREDSNLEAI